MMKHNRIYKRGMSKADMEKRGATARCTPVAGVRGRTARCTPVAGVRGQVTIFIIVGIVIVAALLVFFLWVEPTYISDRTGRLGFEGCVEDAVEDSIGRLGVNAGYVDPEFTVMYKGQDIAYLCYTSEYHKTCTIQKPFLKQHFENEMKDFLRERIDVCYDSSVDELLAQGYDVTSGDVDYDILAEPGVVRVEIEAPTTVGSQRFTRFNVETSTPIYEMLMIATSLLQYETKYGDSDVSEMMFLYPEYIIDKLKQSDGTTIYVIESKDFGTKFQFASRSLAWPAGYI